MELEHFYSSTMPTGWSVNTDYFNTLDIVLLICRAEQSVDRTMQKSSAQLHLQYHTAVLITALITASCFLVHSAAYFWHSDDAPCVCDTWPSHTMYRKCVPITSGHHTECVCARTHAHAHTQSCVFIIPMCPLCVSYEQKFKKLNSKQSWWWSKSGI